MILGFRFQILGCGFRISGFGFRVSGFGFWVLGSEFRVSGFGFLVSGSSFGVRVYGASCKLEGLTVASTIIRNPLVPQPGFGREFSHLGFIFRFSCFGFCVQGEN